MSTSFLIIKVAGASTLTVGSIAGIGYGVHEFLDTKHKAEIKALTSKFNDQSLISDTSSSITSTDTFIVAKGFAASNVDIKTVLDNTINTRNYKCKITGQENNEDNTCLVKLMLPFANDKKHINMTELKAITGSDVKVGELFKSTSYFKIKLNSSVIDKLSWDGSQMLDIYSNNTNSEKIGSLKPIMGVTSSDTKGKTLFSIGKVSKFKNNTADVSVDDISYDETKTNCLFTTTPTQIPCKINKFVSDYSSDHNNFSSLNFLGSLEKSEIIKKERYYLFQFEGESNKKEKTEFKTSSSSDVEASVKVVGSGEASTTVNKLEITNLTPVFVLENAKTYKLLLISDIT